MLASGETTGTSCSSAIEDDGMEPLLVYGADDQLGAGEGVAFDEFADRIHIAGRVVKREVYRVPYFVRTLSSPSRKP